MSVSAGETLANVRQLLNTKIVDYGWEVYDADYYVYRSLNADDSTYKYLKLEVGTNIAVTCVYESWNAETHTGTRRAGPSTTIPTYLNDTTKTGFWITHSAQAIDIYVYASPRWCLISSTFNSQLLTDHYVIPGGKQGSGLYTVRFLIPC